MGSRELYRSIKKTPVDYDMLHRLVEDSMKRVKELQQKQRDAYSCRRDTAAFFHGKCGGCTFRVQEDFKNLE